MRTSAPLARLAALLATLACTLAPAAALAQNAADFAGTYRVASDQITFTVPEWGPDCGQRPESRSGTAGRQATITADGQNLVIQDGRRRYRTDGCWSDNARVRRLWATPSGNRWVVLCQTEESDYQRERGTYTITADGDRVTMRESTDFAWQLRTSRCRAAATRVLVYDRVDRPAPAPDVVAQSAVDVVTAPPPRCANPGAPARIVVAPARRRLAAGRQSCFRVRLLDANSCEVPLDRAGAPVAWQIARAPGAAAPTPNDATVENGCVRAPAGSPVADYQVTVSVGALSERVVASVVSAEDMRRPALAGGDAQIEDEDEPLPQLGPTGTASGAGVGAVVVRPPSQGGGGSGLAIALLAGLGALLAVGGVLLLTRKRPPTRAPRVSDPPSDLRSSVPPGAPDPSSISGRQRRDAVPIPARQMPIGAKPAVSRDAPTVELGPKPAAPAAEPAPAPAPAPEPASAPAIASERPLVKRCPTCDARFTAEMAFCPEHGVALVDAAPVAAPAVSAELAPAASPPPQPAPPTPAVVATARPAPICPKCGKAVEGGARFCPNDGTPVGEDARPLVCPTCGRRFALGMVFCGEDGTSLVAG